MLYPQACFPEIYHMSNPGDIPTRINPNPKRSKPADLLKQVLEMQTSASSIEGDSLEYINEMMADPLRDNLSDAMAQQDPRDDPENPGVDKGKSWTRLPTHRRESAMQQGPIIQARLSEALSKRQRRNRPVKYEKKTRINLKAIQKSPDKLTKKLKAAIARLSRGKGAIARVAKAKLVKILKRTQAAIKELRSGGKGELKGKAPQLGKDEKKVKLIWEKALGIKVSDQIWRTSRTFKRWRKKMEAKYHAAGRDWSAEKGDVSPEKQKKRKRKLKRRLMAFARKRRRKKSHAEESSKEKDAGSRRLVGKLIPKIIPKCSQNVPKLIHTIP